MLTVALLLVTSFPSPEPVADIIVRPDIQYYQGKDADEKKHRLDLYLPANVKNFPVVVFVHGGGYQKGDRTEAKAFGEAFVSKGIGVAAISYRLFPQVKHPEHIRDVARAFSWVKQNIKAAGGNPDQVFISGHSAGAHLAALLATDASYLQEQQLAFKDIRGVIAISGGYRILPIRKDVFGDEAAMKQASPFSHISKGHPAFLIIYGGDENKERHDLSREFQDVLLGAGGRAELAEIKARDHQGLFKQISTTDPTFLRIVKFVQEECSRETK